MKILNYRIIAKPIILATYGLFSISLAQADEPVTNQQGFIQSPYVYYAIGTFLDSDSQGVSSRQAALAWLINNSTVEDGIYTLQFTQSKQGRNGGKLGNLWGSLDLKFGIELLPQKYHPTTSPGLYGSHFTADGDAQTGVRLNRSRVMFTIGSKWY